MKRIPAVLAVCGVMMLWTAPPALHVHAGSDHAHAEHAHGPAAHAHAPAVPHDVPGGPAIAPCDAAEHVVQMMLACTSPGRVLVAVVALGSPTLLVPPSLPGGSGVTPDHRAHAPPDRHALPARAPPASRSL